jgi:acetyltransferase-like isoleucine patch superfamily enzyme
LNASRHLEHDWYPAPVPGNVVMGERSWLYSSFAFLHHEARRPDAVRIGRDTGIYQGTNFDLGPDAEIVIGDFTTIGGVIFCTNGRIEIGDHVLVSYSVVLAGSPFAVPGDEGDGDIFVGDDVWIGAQAVLLPGAVIGDGAIIGARSVVDFEVPPGCIVAGNPARVVRRAEGVATEA